LPDFLFPKLIFSVRESQGLILAKMVARTKGVVKYDWVEILWTWGFQMCGAAFPRHLFIIYNKLTHPSMQDEAHLHKRLLERYVVVLTFHSCALGTQSLDLLGVNGHRRNFNPVPDRGCDRGRDKP
jgi:hypothetical protein